MLSAYPHPIHINSQVEPEKGGRFRLKAISSKGFDPVEKIKDCPFAS